MCPRCVVIGARLTGRTFRSGAASSHHTSLREALLPRLATALAAMLLLAVALRAAQPQASTAPSANTTARVIELRIGDEVEPIMAEYVDDGIEQAAREHASLVLITMDTPGGLEDFDAGHHPAHPGFARAGGGLRLAHRDRAAPPLDFLFCCPRTSRPWRQARTPARPRRCWQWAAVPVNVDDTLKKKILNDATAFLRSYAAKRGRNVHARRNRRHRRQSVHRNRSAQRQADRLHRQFDRRFAGATGWPHHHAIRRLHDAPRSAQSADVPVVEMSARQRFLSRIVQPDVFFILLIVGVIGLYAEFTHPGMVAPGVIGAIALVLALFAMHILPVNFAGLLLIVVALGMFILEAKYTSHGVLAVGGVVAMLLGALMLIRSPLTGAGVSLGVALGVTLPCAVVTVFLMRLVLALARLEADHRDRTTDRRGGRSHRSHCATG